MSVAININELPLGELECLIEKYPWFALARKEYYKRLVKTDKGSIKSLAKEVALFIPSRERLYEETFNPQPEPAPEPEPAPQQNRARYVAAGGDYFTASDFDELESKGEAIGNLGFGIYREGGEYDNAAEQMSQAHEFSLDSVCTETMAGIFADQGYFDRAIELYKKLILLYPEKSAYFATLIEKIKKQNI